MESIHQYLDSFSFPALLAAFVGTSALVWKLFDRADSALSDEGRSAFGAWLAKIEKPNEILNFPARFSELFDSVFGAKHFSWRCFLASSIVSLIVSVILSIILISQNLSSIMTYKGFMGNSGFHWSSLFNMLTSSSELSDDVDAVVYLKTFGTMFFFVNTPADYLSLLQTRTLISWMKKFNNPLSIISFLILDAVLNCLIFIFFLGVVFFLFLDGGSLPSFELAPEEYYYYIKSMLMFNYHYDVIVTSYSSLEASPAPFFYSTWFTSAWLYLFVVSSATIWFFKYIFSLFFGFRKFADLEKKPMQFLSVVSTGLIFIMYSVFALVYLFKTII